MKRLWISAWMALLLLCLATSASAWGPERFYDSREDLPIEVNAYLERHLKPGESMQTAHKNGHLLPVLTKTQEDARRLFIFEETEAGFACILESGELPDFQGFKPGIMSNLNSISLTYRELTYFTFTRLGGRWLLSYVYGQDEFTIQAYSIVRSYHISRVNPQDIFPDYGRYTGERDLVKMTEADFPRSYAEALSKLDKDGIAVVNNPDPQDRLHLREKPDRSSASLGKFYTGTPVQVLQRKGDWARIRLGHLEGWMMRAYLAEGRRMAGIKPAFLDWSQKEDRSRVHYFSHPDTRNPALPAEVWTGNHNDPIIGVFEEDWLILMNDAGDVCYVLREAYSPGNG